MLHDKRTSGQGRIANLGGLKGYNDCTQKQKCVCNIVAHSIGLRDGTPHAGVGRGSVKRSV